MSPDRWRQVKDVFVAAKDRPRIQRQAFVAESCGDDAELRQEVDSLLSHHESLHGFLDAPQNLPAPRDNAAGEHALPCDHIGPYRLLRVLGSGGMGVVYLAEQESPRREVALKVLRAGALAPRAIRRFEIEAQVLARLQHPGIAQIFEAGTATLNHPPSSAHVQPYFAMELIRGRPLTEYAESVHLGTGDRIELFIKVCEAVQYAHQKGVIHRDLKPANILVVDDETHRQPKILDFGIARVTDSDMQITTMQTHVGQLVGTVPYMSPEQLAGHPDEIDTRSDVYALGVLLFELLSGRLPHDVTKCSLPEALRIISEQDPTSLSSINKIFRGDLDTILAKALEKDRQRRYSSASELAADLGRFLHDEPISARRPSTFYQFHKFAKRNKALVAGAAFAFVALATGVVATTWQAVAAIEARDRARQETARFEALYQFFSKMLYSHEIAMSGSNLELATITPKAGREVRLADVLDKGAADIARPSAQQKKIEPDIHNVLARAYYALGLYSQAETEYRAVQEVYRRRSAPDDPEALNAATNLGLCLQAQGRFAPAEDIYRDTLERRRRVLGRDHPDSFESLVLLLWVLDIEDKRAEHEVLMREALACYRPALESGRKSTLERADVLGLFLLAPERYSEARPLYEAVVQSAKRVLPAGDWQTGVYEIRYGVCLEHLLHFEEAEHHLMKGYTLFKSVLGPRHEWTLVAADCLACMYERWKKPENAAPYRAMLQAAASQPATSASATDTNLPARRPPS